MIPYCAGLTLISLSFDLQNVPCLFPMAERRLPLFTHAKHVSLHHRSIRVGGPKWHCSKTKSCGLHNRAPAVL